VYNRPQDRLGDWLFEPLVIIKEQLKAANLTESEELYMQKWILTSGDRELLTDWDNGGVEPKNDMRKGELQALCRRYHPAPYYDVVLELTYGRLSFVH
jgi:hypothetical protein